MNDKQEGILFTIDCLNSHKYNFDYNLEELVKEAKKLQSNWNSLREWLNDKVLTRAGSSIDLAIENHSYCKVLDKMNELESGE